MQLVRVTLVLAIAAALACAGTTKRQPHLTRKKPVARGGPPPAWVTRIEVGADELCGIGAAGAAFDKSSPYPKRLAEERAVKNLAGALETNIQEAIVERETNRGHRIDTARLLTIDEALLEQVAGMVETEFWLDQGGTGTFAQKNFTYAHACLDATIAADTFKVDVDTLRGRGRAETISPRRVPKWIRRTGKQPGGRLCAVGFSLPTFHPDKTFDVVVEDVRSQLAEVLQTLVSSYHEELTTARYQLYELMTVATTQAISKGAIITAFWYDRDGIGPFRRKRTTYGIGCVYPVDVMTKAVEAVENELPEQTVAKVRERARAAFDELDAEIEKRERSAAPEPTRAPEVAAPEPTRAPETAAPALEPAQVPAPAPGAAVPEPARAVEPERAPGAAAPEPARAAEPERTSETAAPPAEAPEEFDPSLLDNIEYH